MNLDMDTLEQRLQETIRTTIQNGVASRPEGAELSSEAFCDHLWAELADLAALGFSVPLELNGLELGQAAVVIVCEELGRQCLATPYMDTITAVDCLEQPGDKHRDILAAIAAGEVRVGTVGMGPVDGRQRVTVREQNGVLTVHGEGGLMINPTLVDHLLIQVSVKDGAAAFFVPVDREGITFLPQPDIGEGGCHAVRYEGLVLRPDDRLHTPLGPVVARIRIRQAAYLIGLAAGAHAETVQYTNRRRQFNRRILDFQSVKLRLAALLARLEATRLAMQRAAWMDDQKQDSLYLATVALALASELALDVTREGVHLHGAYGMTRQSGIERYYRCAAIEAVRCGTPPQLWLAASDILAEQESVFSEEEPHDN